MAISEQDCEEKRREESSLAIGVLERRHDAPSAAAQPREFAISLSAAKAARLSFGAVAFFALAGIAAEWFKRLDFPWPGSEWFSTIFGLDEELNIPTWCSAFALLLAAGLLAVIASEHRRKSAGRFAYPWKALSIIFLVLAADEALCLHELLIFPKLRTSLNLSSAFFHTWVIPYAAALLVFAVAYWKFFCQLPVRFQILFAAAATLYIGGAMGMELVGGYLIVSHGFDSLFYSISIVVEETLEMAGIALFLYALVAYLAQMRADASLRILFRENAEI